MMSLLAIPSLRASLLVVLGVAALALVACGGGDEDSGEPTAVAETPTGTATPTETVTPTETATQPPTETPTATPSPEPDGGDAVDARYLRDLCVAGNDFQAAVFMALVSGNTGAGDGDEEDAEPSLTEFMEELSEPLATLLERLQALTPPDDVAEFHAAALAGYEQFMETLTAMDTNVDDPDAASVDPLDLLSNLMMTSLAAPPLPEATLARLAQVAESVPECEDSSFLNTFLRDSGPPMDPGATDAVPAEDVMKDVTPEDEAYVRELCLTGKTFESALLESFAGLDIDPVAATREAMEDPQLFARIYLEPMRALAAEMRLMTPPASAAAAHTANIDYLGEMVAILDVLVADAEAGRESASVDTARFEAMREAEAPMFSSEDANRLAAAANNVSECYGSGFLFGILGGGLSGGGDGGVVGSDSEEGEIGAGETGGGSGGAGASAGSANATPGSEGR